MRMIKTVCTLNLWSIVAVGLFISICQSYANEKQGFIKGNSYQNDYFQFQLTVPAHWHNKLIQPLPEKADTKVIPLFQFSNLPETQKHTIENIIITGEALSIMTSDNKLIYTDPKQYLIQVFQIYKNISPNADSSADLNLPEVNFGNKKFSQIFIKSSQGSSILNIHIYATILQDYLLVIHTFHSEQNQTAEEQLNKILKTIKFNASFG